MACIEELCALQGGWEMHDLPQNWGEVRDDSFCVVPCACCLCGCYYPFGVSGTCGNCRYRLCMCLFPDPRSCCTTGRRLCGCFHMSYLHSLPCPCPFDVRAKLASGGPLAGMLDVRIRGVGRSWFVQKGGPRQVMERLHLSTEVAASSAPNAARGASVATAVAVASPSAPPFEESYELYQGEDITVAVRAPGGKSARIRTNTIATIGSLKLKAVDALGISASAMERASFLVGEGRGSLRRIEGDAEPLMNYFIEHGTEITVSLPKGQN